MDNYLFTQCNDELPPFIITPEQVNYELNSGDVVCVLNPLGSNTCYNITIVRQEATTTNSITVNQIFEDCQSCETECTTPINNILLTPCVAGQDSIIVPASSYNYPITSFSDTICLSTGDYQNACYRVSTTQLPTTSQEIITPNAFYGTCVDCQANCFYKFYNLQDCQTGEVYLDSTGNPVQFFYTGSTSTYVTSLGGINFLTSVVLTNIFNSSGTEIAKGCLNLVEIDYVQGQNYFSVLNGIDNVFFTDTCVQCKLKSCGDCNTLETENINCKFGDQVYALMLSVRYGIETCCDEDLQKWSIKKELVDLTNMKNSYIKCCASLESCNTCAQTTCNCNSCNN